MFPPIIGRFAHEHVTDVVESRAFVDSVAAQLKSGRFLGGGVGEGEGPLAEFGAYSGEGGGVTRTVAEGMTWAERGFEGGEWREDEELYVESVVGVLPLAGGEKGVGDGVGIGGIAIGIGIGVGIGGIGIGIGIGGIAIGIGVGIGGIGIGGVSHRIVDSIVDIIQIVHIDITHIGVTHTHVPCMERGRSCINMVSILHVTVSTLTPLLTILLLLLLPLPRHPRHILLQQRPRYQRAIPTLSASFPLLSLTASHNHPPLAQSPTQLALSPRVARRSRQLPPQSPHLRVSLHHLPQRLRDQRPRRRLQQRRNHQHVLRLDICVHDAAVVQEGETREHLALRR